MKRRDYSMLAGAFAREIWRGKWELITPKRRALTGAGPLSIREVARRVGRDVKSVHGDV